MAKRICEWVKLASTQFDRHHLPARRSVDGIAISGGDDAKLMQFGNTFVPDLRKGA